MVLTNSGGGTYAPLAYNSPFLFFYNGLWRAWFLLGSNKLDKFITVKS